ncbi:MAG: guanylate kinase [Cyclobacteriaceae bacterium]|nr:guanylate kinase [Cyclobacteriaceae bacterium]
MNGKAIIFSAPSGSGKTTIVRYLLNYYPQLCFSISATTRLVRGEEVDGKDYYFLRQPEFERKIKNKEFVEWEEVYEGLYYGTLKSEIERIWNQGNVVIFDVDVKGGKTLKQYFGKDALAVFIRPPSVEVLRQRLIGRNTDGLKSIEDRLNKAGEELTYEKYFDISVVNDDLNTAVEDVKEKVGKFINI